VQIDNVVPAFSADAATIDEQIDGHLQKPLFGVGLVVAVWFSVVSGFNLRFSGGALSQQLQPHNLFVAARL
jgi:hypothetical protein